MEFREIYGFPAYQISQTGIVKAGNKQLKLCKHPRGYWQIVLGKGGHSWHKLVHRLVLETWVGPCPEGCVCHHIDGDKTNNDVSNLEWVSQKANIWNRKDRIPEKHCPICEKLFKPKERAQKTCSPECGTKFRSGEQSVRSKLLGSDVRDIRKRRANGEKGIELAKEYGITPSAVCDIVKRRCWKHIY